MKNTGGEGRDGKEERRGGRGRKKRRRRRGSKTQEESGCGTLDRVLASHEMKP